MEPLFAVILFTNNKIDENRQCEWRKAEKTHCRFLYKKMEKMRKNIGIQGLLFSFI